jgi:heptosyltransferase-2
MSYKNFLIISLAGLGDFINATSAMSLIKKEQPDSFITVITYGAYKQYANNNPAINKVISYRSIKDFNNKTLFHLWKVLWLIKNFFSLLKLKHDICIFLDNTNTFFILVAKILAIKNIACPKFDRHGNGIEFKLSNKINLPIDLPKNSDKFNISQRYQTIVKTILNTCNMTNKTVLPSSKNDLAQIYIEKGNAEFKIGISFRGGSKNFLPNNKVIEVIKILNSHINASFFLLGTQDSFVDAEKIIKSVSQISIKNLCGKTNLLEIKAILANINLILTVDGGIMHIAANAQTKIVALFGAAFPEHAFPLTHKAIALCAYSKCAPCSSKFSVNNKPFVCTNPVNYKCLIDIPNLDIVNACLKLLEGNK